MKSTYIPEQGEPKATAHQIGTMVCSYKFKSKASPQGSLSPFSASHTTKLALNWPQATTRGSFGTPFPRFEPNKLISAQTCPNTKLLKQNTQLENGSHVRSPIPIMCRRKLAKVSAHFIHAPSKSEASKQMQPKAPNSDRIENWYV